jgi:hypothetical protein
MHVVREFPSIFLCDCRSNEDRIFRGYDSLALWHWQNEPGLHANRERFEVLGRDTKRVHQGRLDSARHFGDPSLAVTAFDNVYFGERHGLNSFCYATGNPVTLARVLRVYRMNFLT